MTREERYAWEKDLRLRALGVLTHAQKASGARFSLPPEARSPLEVIREYRRSKQRLNPLRAIKKRMMREGNLSSRQWGRFRKRMSREAKREMAGG